MRSARCTTADRRAANLKSDRSIKLSRAILSFIAQTATRCAGKSSRRTKNVRGISCEALHENQAAPDLTDLRGLLLTTVKREVSVKLDKGPGQWSCPRSRCTKLSCVFYGYFSTVART